MKSIKFLLVAPLLLLAAQAWGQNCWVSSVPVIFGEYIAVSPAPTESRSGAVNVECTVTSETDAAAPLISIRVKLDTGKNSTTFAQRQMLQREDGVSKLGYNLYVTEPIDNCMDVWGDGETSSTKVITKPLELNINPNSPGAKTLFPFSVCGRITPNQPVPVGIYDDVVGITVEFF